jgi:hypothetical protein
MGNFDGKIDECGAEQSEIMDRFFYKWIAAKKQ